MMKKIGTRSLSVLLAFLLVIASCGMLAGQAFAVSRFEGVAKSTVNVRTKPNSSSTRVGKITKGEKVVITASVKKGSTKDGVTADMDFLKLEDGGYVAASYITLTKKLEDDTTTDTTTETTDTETTDTETTTETTDTETTTETTDTETTTETTTEKTEDDTSFEVTDTETTTETAEATETTTTDTSLPPNAEAKKMQASSAVNVRSEPSTSGKATKKLASGAVVTTVGVYNDGDDYNGATVEGTWYQLYDGGFVDGAYLKAAGGTSSSTSTKQVTVVTATSDTKLYTSPSKLSTKIGTFKKGSSKNLAATYKSGSTYKEIKVSGTWYKLSDGSFVPAGTVKLSTKNESSTTTSGSAVVLAVGDGVKASSSVNIRKGPSTSTSKLGLFAKGDTAVIVAVAKSGTTVDGVKVSGTWYKLSNGGYVHGNYVQFDSATTLSNYGKSADTSTTTDDDSDIPFEDA